MNKLKERKKNQSLLTAANSAMREERFDDAIKIYENLITESP